MERGRTSENLLDNDPRTGLKLAKIPIEYTRLMPQLKQTVVYWIGEVKKINRHWKKDRRTLIVTDKCIYMVDKDRIRRCTNISKVTDFIEDPSYPETVAFKTNEDLDCLFDVSTRQDKADIKRIVGAVSQHLFQKPLKERKVKPGERLEEIMPRKHNVGWSRAEVNLRLTPQKKLLNLEQHQRNSEDDTRTAVRTEFEHLRTALSQKLQDYREHEIEEAKGEIEGYIAMIEERDREIETLRETYLSLKENPEFWKSCPRCKTAQLAVVNGAVSPEERRKQALKQQLEDYQQLIDHLQMTRAGGEDVLIASSEVAALRKGTDSAEEKVRKLQRLIIDHPYPTEDIRIRADQIADTGEAAVLGEESERCAELQATITELQRQHALKERELKHSRSVLRDAFRRQVDELDGVRQQFQRYDEHVVDYLEKVFDGNAFPQGPDAFGQTPEQLARATSQAARQAATPPAFPQHTASVNMPPSSFPHADDLTTHNSRVQPRGVNSPIAQFVPPNVLSSPSASPPRPQQQRQLLPTSGDPLFYPLEPPTSSNQPLGTAPLSTSSLPLSSGRGSGRRSIL